MRPVMAGISKYVLWVWALNVAVELGLLLALASRKHYRNYPAFFSYICVDLLQAVVLLPGYLRWGFSAALTERFAWGTQGIVIFARAWAIAEICWHLLGQYSGIWALARRILLFFAFLVALYSILTAGWQWDQTVLKADLGLELTIGVVIVILFLFARYYEIVADPALRVLAIGFFLFSCFTVVNGSILQHKLKQYEDLWRILGILAFLASLSLWFSAFRKPLPVLASGPALLPGDVYRTLAPEVNVRLRRLNEQLSKLGRSRKHRS
jgi:hypothetical protein